MKTYHFFWADALHQIAIHHKFRHIDHLFTPLSITMGSQIQTRKCQPPKSSSLPSPSKYKNNGVHVSPSTLIKHTTIRPQRPYCGTTLTYRSKENLSTQNIPHLTTYIMLQISTATSMVCYILYYLFRSN